MPVLREGSSGDVVRALQQLLTNGASGAWGTVPQGIDGKFGPRTKASVQAFQSWGGVTADGVVGDQTWAVSLHAASATLESAVGLKFVVRARHWLRAPSRHRQRCERVDVGHDVDDDRAVGLERLRERSRDLRRLLDADAEPAHVLGNAGKIDLAEGPHLAR